MEDFLQLIVKCFPIATFILVAFSCTSKPKEPHRSSARKLTMSTSSLTSEEDKFSVEDKSEEKTEEKTEEDPEKIIDLETLEDRKVACGNKKDPKEKSEETPESNKKKEEIKVEQDIMLDESNPHVAYLLGPEKDIAQSVLHSRCALEQTAAFQWTMKKRLSFDEGCWKHLSRRISAIKAEGFEVRVNTRKARENKQNADRETKLDAIFARWAVGKPKKKGVE